MGMTYFKSQAVLVIAYAMPSALLRRSPAVNRLRHMGPIGVGETQRILNKKPPARRAEGVLFRSLAMTYSHMGKPHTTIGDAPFHC